MSARSKLKRAIRAIEDAQTSLRRANVYAGNDIDISKANNELENAKADIKRAMRETD